MVRDFDKWKESKDKHYQSQLDYFNTIRDNLIKKSNEWRKKGESAKADQIQKEANKMQFAFTENFHINYGNCTKFNKPVSFIPDTCQIETQNCFEHRKQNQTKLV
jgi:hypothetical protein